MHKHMANGIAIISLISSMMAHAGGAGGGSIVFDPSNFAKNTITAAQSIAIETRQASQYAMQLQQYLVQFKQRMELNPNSMTGPFNDVMNTYRTVQQYQSALAGLRGSVGELQSVMNNRMNLMAASGLSWDQYIQREQDTLNRRENGTTMLSSYERQVISDASQRYAQVRALQPQIMATKGTHQAMMAMNAQMNVLMASMQDLITLTAAQGNNKTAEQAEKLIIENRKINAQIDYENARKKSEADSWGVLKQMTGGN